MKQRLAIVSLLSAVCLALYWPGLWVWFAMDDFAWLGLRMSVQSWEEVPALLLAPMAQGTIRPLSERLYFVTLEGLFGLEALPFRIVAFAVQILNLWLVARLVERMTGSRWGGVVAALLWLCNSALALAMSWTSAFNQILWPCFLLAACHWRWTWLTTGARLALVWEWLFFLLGFGALELQVVYPAIAAAMTLLYRRDRWKELIPLFAVAGAYAAFNRSIAKTQATPVYQLFWDPTSVAGTFSAYMRMATGLWRPDLLREGEFWWVLAEWLVGGALAAGVLWLIWRRERLAAFGVVWFLATLAPILPLKNHVSDYYLTVPTLGLAMAAGVAVARRPAWAVVPVLVYGAGSGYLTRKTVDYNFERAEQGRVLFAGVMEASQLHPGKLILLTSVSSDQYWGLLNDSPFRLVEGLRVYLAPGTEENIERHPDLGDPAQFVLAGAAARTAVESGDAVVYSPAGGKLRNVTALWKGLARDRWGGLSTVVELGQPMMNGQVGKGWYPIETGFRWSGREASLRLGAPGNARQIVVEGFRGEEAGRRGKVTVQLRLNGLEAGRWEMLNDNGPLHAVAPLPDQLDRTKPVQVDLVVSPVIHEEGSGGRALGLAVIRIGFH